MIRAPDAFIVFNRPQHTAHSFSVIGSQQLATNLLRSFEKGKDESVWCRAILDFFKEALSSTGYPDKKIHFIKGMVEQTITHFVPEKNCIVVVGS